jgi:hypothetical protein
MQLEDAKVGGHFQVNKRLGAGAFGEVYSGIYNSMLIT